MSLSSELAGRAVDLVDDQSTAWLDKLLDEGCDLANSHGDGLPGGKDAALATMAILEDAKAPLLRMRKIGFAHVVAAWADNDEAEARRLYLAMEATYAERRAAMHAAGDAAANDRDEREAAWQSVKSMLLAIGTVGLKFVVSLVCKTLGIPDVTGLI